ncbi:MAG TPA: type II toxin-antitoxin system RelE/ParE family toxin [Acidobacteriota bacterium]|nr:type II toxin-antitoxin system RelE/ParE family toxin [Acidobacteriota bacterium]
MIRWERRAATELKALQKKGQQKVFDSVTDLRNDPLKGKPLSGRWKGLRRLRVGRYRVIYGFDGEELLVLIVRVGHRRDVYR